MDARLEPSDELNELQSIGDENVGEGDEDGEKEFRRDVHHIEKLIYA